ncbi:MAG: hypothetical protein ACOYB3_01690 [Azonexus sp.]
MKRVELAAWERYFDARDQGIGVESAAKKARISASTAWRFERGDQASSGLEAASILGRHTVGGQMVAQPLSAEALASLEDFATFRLRYFGRKSTNWQSRAALDVLRAVEGKDREYLVINCPPGSGKSTLFTHDIPCWLIARDRSIRIQIGSRTERQARMYVGRIKKSLERDAPMRTDADSLTAGVAFDAIACLQDDFGSFRPDGRGDLWRAEGLVVRQLDGVSLDDKEPTASAWGMDSGFLGGRFDLVLWDDLVDRKNTKTQEGKESLREWYFTEAETRLEPGGALILQGQRIAHDDLYRTCLDLKTLDERPKYRHIVYKAHDEERCHAEHDGQTLAWPDSCLLDPYRLPWKQLETIAHNNPRTFAVMYQQEDGDIVGGLVEPEWITGGIDSSGYPAPGCLDKERYIGEIPVHLTGGRAWSFVTVDPSPTEWWGVIWWLYDPVSGNRYAVDLVRRKMNPEQFLSLDLDTFDYSGLMVEMREDSIRGGVPISHVIVEVNAAQRWLLQQPHVQRWIDATGVQFLPHTTGVNKNDPKYGVESLGDLFRQGRIRLPFADPSARMKTNALVTEATRYPDSDTTDMVMSTWFQALAVNNNYSPRQSGLYRRDVPDWVSGRGTGMPVSRGLSYSGR